MPIHVAITISGDSAIIDFARGLGRFRRATSMRIPAIVTAAVMYVLRLLIGEEIPLNQGVLAPITIILPPNSLLSPDARGLRPEEQSAVVGGNVETSQRVVDVLLGALGWRRRVRGR